jgi:branched-subunit amino acid aminotransferase/4-amino-4-deoxychorismate lyase
MGGLAHVRLIDGRLIGDGEKGPVTKKLQAVYDEAVWNQATKLPSVD